MSTIYTTKATSRPATPMANPLTLFLSAALDSLGVGLDSEVLDVSEDETDEDSLVEVTEDWLDEVDGDSLDDSEDDEDSTDEVDSTPVLVLNNKINMRSKVTSCERMMRLTLD